MFHYCYINLTYFQYWFSIATIHQSECQLREGSKIVCHNACVCVCVSVWFTLVTATRRLAVKSSQKRIWMWWVWAEWAKKQGMGREWRWVCCRRDREWPGQLIRLPTQLSLLGLRDFLHLSLGAWMKSYKLCLTPSHWGLRIAKVYTGPTNTSCL